MKTIGMLGGMSWESTAVYYTMINEGIREKAGGLHSAKICLYSVDFDEIEKLQRSGDWDATADELSAAARKVESAGADFLLICTNTMHLVAPQIERALTIPILHIVDATAEALTAAGIGRVGLLGTRFTMEQEFYKGRLVERYGVDVIVPDDGEREIVHRVIYDELCLGKIMDDSREQYLHIIASLKSRGAEAIILGCTEIASLVQQHHTDVPLYDTTAIHASKAVEMALSE